MQLLKHPQTSFSTRMLLSTSEISVKGFQHHRIHFDSLIVSCAKGLKDYCSIYQHIHPVNTFLLVYLMHSEQPGMTGKGNSS